MTMPIIQHTLPTVVGMGVTSRAVETMFSKKRGTATRRKSAKRVSRIKPKLVKPKKRVIKSPPKSRPRPKHTRALEGWVQVSRAEMERLVGVAKANLIRAKSPESIKIGMYDHVRYIGGKYYLNLHSPYG